MRIAVLCSGSGTNFENLVTQCPEHDFVLMIHNKEDCGAIKRADRLGIPHIHLTSREENEIIAILININVELVVLAGWMRVLSSEFIKAFPRQIINIHPSLLPKYKGLHAIQQALDAGDNITGCTVHYVTEELDAGEIIDQSHVHISKEDTLETLTHRIQRAEHRLLPLVVKQIERNYEFVLN